MSKLKAIFYPAVDGDVAAFMANANTELTTGGLGTKYGISAPKLAKILAHKTDIQPAIDEVTATELAAKSAVTAKNKELANSKIDLLDVFGDINRSANLDEVDAQALGMRKSHTPPNPDTAQPKITHATVLPDQIILDWTKGPWFGVVVYGSFDGTNFSELDKDNRSPYEDKRMNQKVNVPEKRFYQMRYFDKEGTLIGIMSLATSVVAEIYPVVPTP